MKAKAHKPYKVVKPKKDNRRSTVSNRNFRFQSFTERITNLKIDPIRKRRYVEGQEEQPEESRTYFGQSLLEWTDTNLSQTFTAFAKETLLLGDNLAMVIHNENKIMDLLVSYINKADALAMEPLLDLMAKFARDLDIRFEKHFERAVSTVIAVAAVHADFAVIEWSFTCLAWLFKYLSRLLAPDLRPLYNLMAPYLGKRSQRAFVVRFTAESLSFLLRKAAVVYERDPRPLGLIINHVLEDCDSAVDEPHAELYQQGIMTLLTEATKGIQGAVHSGGPAIIRSMFRSGRDLFKKEDSVVDYVVNGALTSVIHHCTTENFQPVMELILETSESAVASGDLRAISFASRLLFTVASVRKGSRISEWKPVVSSVKSFLDECQRFEEIDGAAASNILSCLAVSLQTATIDALLQARNTAEVVRTQVFAPYFLEYCDLFYRLGTDRFETFVLPQFQAFLNDQSSIPSERGLILLAKFSRGKSQLKLPKDIVDGLLGELNEIATADHASLSEEGVRLASSRLSVLRLLSLDQRQSLSLQKTLLRLVEQAVVQERPSITPLRDLALGSGFSHLLDTADAMTILKPLWEPLCNVSHHYVELPQFWSNILCTMRSISPEALTGSTIEVLESALLKCLSGPSHTIREKALDILNHLYRSRSLDVPNALSIMILIESMPVSLDTSRSISMSIRRLAPEYASISSDDLMLKAVPSYCFGLLHLKLSQAWTDSITTLSAICESKAGEEAVVAMAQSWLEGKITMASAEQTSIEILDNDSPAPKVYSDFECPNMAKLSAIVQQVFQEPHGGMASLSSDQTADSSRISYITSNSRTQALKLLDKVPNVAEKRSRLLVPVLLRWTGLAGNEDADIPDQTDRWSRKDQKAMLGVFAQFVNPKVLYKSSEVYDALLSLCANGDVEIQRSALKAILAWKNSAINRHQEHLNNLLDDARFREEISVFLQDDSEENAIQPGEHEHLMPVLLRLLYGKSIAGGKDGQAGRRKAIFVALSRFGPDVLEQFLHITLSALGDTEESVPGGLSDEALQSLKTPLRQQLGSLNMMSDMLGTLGSELEPLSSKMMNAILLCTVGASRKLNSELGSDENTQTSLLRTIRQTGIQCLVKLFNNMESLSSQKHGPYIVEELIKPRLAMFAFENAQSISGALRLISAWTNSDANARIFAGCGHVILARTAELLQGQHTKDEVRLFILQEVLDPLAGGDVDDAILRPVVSDFVKSIGSIIQRQPSKDVLDASVKSFSLLAVRITNSDEAADVVKTCTELLRKPGKEVSQGTKAGLLRTLLPLIDRFQLSGANDDLYNAVCPLFSRLSEPSSRELLAKVLSVLVRDDSDLSVVATACLDMTAMGSRLDEPDYDRRERAFKSVYDNAAELSIQQWHPIVHSCLFFIRDPEDRVNRASASHALNLFVDAVASQAANSDAWYSVLEDAVFQGIENGMRAPSELVRAEYLLVLGHIVEKMPSWSKVKSMEALVVGGDEEASFFTNVLHIQHHRRLRALRRLSEDATQLSAYSVTRIFLPLLEHFVFDSAEGDAGRTLSDQAVQTIGALARKVNWSSFRATFQRYITYLKSKPDLEKTVLRLLGSMVDGLNVDIAKAHSENIIKDHLPPLLDYLHHKDESTVDRRMPVAVTIVKLLRMLPEEEFAARLPAVLTDMSHVLRSRSQEARDQTRASLTAILMLIGANYFKFILKELQSALKRGYQLHVLSFTVHALLVSGNFETGDLDECLPELMLVIMDDIFGVTGQEKDAEEYKSGMKEVKSSKSFDTMELLARITPIAKLGELIKPIRDLLSERLDLKSVKKIDDLLTRLRKGLDQNPASESRDMLSFCWEVVNQVYAENNAATSAAPKIDERRKRYIVQPEARMTKDKRGTTSFRFKLVSFALNLLRKVLRRHEDLQTPQNMAGLLPIAGDALVQGQEEVKLAAIRFLSTIMRVDMPQLDDNALVYVKESVAMLQGANSMTTDSSKAALELVTSVLREKRSIDIREKDMAVILKSIKPDIDEPDKQGIIYRFLRAVVGRKIIITEVYDVMDEVGRAMITNPDRSIRESARSAYLQFVLEYPQGKDRWQKQTNFMVGNLQYEHAAGRQSIMEFMHQILGKIGDEVLEQILIRIFVSLLPVLVSDIDTSCRDMAGLLIGKLFERASEAKLLEMLALLETWLKPEKKATTKAAALQCWAILLHADRITAKQLESFRGKLYEIFSDEESISSSDVVIDALKAFTALVETSPAVALSRKSAKLWSAIQAIPESSNDQILELVASLLGLYFTDFASTSSKLPNGLASLPLRGSGGLELDEEDLRRLCVVHLRALRAVSDQSPEALAAQNIRNLAFLGRCFAANGVLWRGLTQQEESDDNGDEDSDDDDDASDDEESSHAANGKTTRSALSYLLLRLSKLVLQPTNSPAARLAAMSCTAILLPHLPRESLPVQSLLRPLYALTDPSIPNPATPAYKSLEDKAHELLEVMQKKLGQQEYVDVLAVTRAEAKARRDGRRQKRRIEAVAAPEKWAKEKKRRYEVKKAKSRAKGEEARGKRRGW